MAVKPPVTRDDDKGSNAQGNKTLASAAYERIKADVTNGLFEPDQRLRIEQ